MIAVCGVVGEPLDDCWVRTAPSVRALSGVRRSAS